MGSGEAEKIEPMLVDGPGVGLAPRAPDPWEFELLRLLGEQGAIPLDRVARFLDGDERSSRPRTPLERLKREHRWRALVIRTIRGHPATLRTAVAVGR